MFLAEFLCEFTRAGFEHLSLELVSLGHQLLENPLWLPHERRAHAQLAESRARQMKFVISKQFLKYGQQPARAGFFRCRSFCQQTQRFVLEADLDSVRAKRTLVLPEQTALGILHDVEKVIRVEFFANYTHRQAPNEFRLEPVLDEILRRDVLEQLVVHHLNWLRAEPDLAMTNAPGHLLFQFFECAAYHKKNVAGIDRIASGFAASLEFERRL